MKRRIALWCILLIAAGATIAACNNGVGAAGIDGTGSPMPNNPIAPDPPTPTTPAASNVIAYGTVTAFGSIWVNGVEYETSQATFTINGQPGDQSDLDVGDVVLVVATADSEGQAGIAQRVVFNSLLEGPISAIDADRYSFTALGQTVEITQSTVFDEVFPQQSLAGLRVGDVVEVSGFRAANEVIKATRVDAKEFGRREFETTGTVADLDSVARRFRISGLVVDFGAAMIEAFPGGAITQGDVVRARGSSLRADGSFVATSVELVPAVSGNAGDQVELEGYITSGVPLCVGGCGPSIPSMSFSVERVSVQTTPTTVYEGGSVYNLWYGIKVEVEGALRADRVLIASKVRFSYVDPIQITAQVDSVDATSGSLTTLGITVRTDALTRIADQSGARIQPFSLANLVVGDYVSIRGIEFPADSGELLASAIERHDPVAEIELQGYFQSATWPIAPWRCCTTPPMPWLATVQILGVTVVTKEDTSYGAVDGATLWFDIGPGVLVRARGVLIGDRRIEASYVSYGDTK